MSGNGKVENVSDAAGEASVLPSASVAATWNVWSPPGTSATSHGDVHGAGDPASTQHSNVLPASVDVKVNVGTPVPGPPVIVVSGGVASLNHSTTAGAPYPAAWILTLWLPSGYGPSNSGLEQGP